MMKKGKKAKSSGKTKKILFIVGGCVFVLLIAILVFNLVTIKTFKCKYQQDMGFGMIIKFDTKAKFRFGKPISSHSVTTYDYTDATIDENGMDDIGATMKESIKMACKKSDGCKYKLEVKGKTVEIVVDRKYDKEAKEKWLEEYDYKEYVDSLKDVCE